jgi:hypothetical protein
VIGWESMDVGWCDKDLQAVERRGECSNIHEILFIGIS